MVKIRRLPLCVDENAIRDVPIAEAVENLWSVEQLVRGGVSSPSRAQSWK
jgi:hypothetical protein